MPNIVSYQLLFFYLLSIILLYISLFCDEVHWAVCAHVKVPGVLGKLINIMKYNASIFS